MSEADKKKEWDVAEAKLAKLLGDEEEEGDPREMAKQDDLVYQLLGGFLATHKDVVEESTENRSQIQEELDHLHDILLGKTKDAGRMRECEINALVQLRKVQADSTSSLVHLMDSISKLIAASRHFANQSKSKVDNDLRKIVGRQAEPPATEEDE